MVLKYQTGLRVRLSEFGFVLVRLRLSIADSMCKSWIWRNRTKHRERVA